MIFLEDLYHFLDEAFIYGKEYGLSKDYFSREKSREVYLLWLEGIHKMIEEERKNQIVSCSKH
jgi:hypothetical protein